jgi:hypothetical protein
MKRLTFTASLFALATLFAVPAHAQDIEHGLWSGAITPPGGQAVPVMYQVNDVDGGLTIVMSNPENGPMEFADETVEGDQLTFWWDIGIRIDCTLMRQGDGSFRGTCSDGHGEGPIWMTPPGA